MLPAEHRELQGSLKMERFFFAPDTVMRNKIYALSGNPGNADRMFVFL